jgi:DNA-directed RNA polymerase specialized sigma24 family protein
MSSTGSVSHWLLLLKSGDHAAAQPLWERYFQRLVSLARAKLRDAPAQMADDEDVALSAFASFCQEAQRGKYPDLQDRHDLWRLLVLLTAHKAIDRLRHERRKKRQASRRELFDLSQVVGPEPSAEFAALVADEYRRLLALLDDPELVSVARWKLEGYTTDEMAAKLGYVSRTIERKLQVIRTIWAGETVL